MGEAVKWIAIAALIVVGLLWWNNHSFLCDSQCRETQSEVRADRQTARASQSNAGRTAQSRAVGGPCTGERSGRPGVWKVDPSNGRLGCWVK